MSKYKILIKTKDFVNEFAKKEISNFYSDKIERVSKNLFRVCFEEGTEKELFNFVYDLFYFSRVIENVYLEIINFRNEEFINLIEEDLSFIKNIKKELTFEVDALKSYKFNHLEGERIFGKRILELCNNLKVNLENYDISFKLFTEDLISYLVIDLVGFSLTKREFKINYGANSINSLIPNSLFYLMKLDENKNITNKNKDAKNNNKDKNKKNKMKISILDPLADFGDIIIEVSYFLSNEIIHFKKRFDLKIRNLFDFPFETTNYKEFNLKSTNKSKNIYYGVVQNNKVFKLLKENVAYSSQNIKISQFDLDWLDVKFKEGQFDYVITQIPEIHDLSEREEFLKEFFYQTRFIVKKKVGIISKKEIEKTFFKRDKFKILIEKKIFVGEQKYLIYIIE